MIWQCCEKEKSFYSFYNDIYSFQTFSGKDFVNPESFQDWISQTRKYTGDSEKTAPSQHHLGCSFGFNISFFSIFLFLSMTGLEFPRSWILEQPMLFYFSLLCSKYGVLIRGIFFINKHFAYILNCSRVLCYEWTWDDSFYPLAHYEGGPAQVRSTCPLEQFWSVRCLLWDVD